MSAQIVLENIGVRFPHRVLFEQVNWTLYEGMRVALAGRNGSGKSTLLRILAGESEPMEGKRTVVGSRKLKIGFLDQTLLDKAVVEAFGLKDKSISSVPFLETRLRNDPHDHEDRRWEIKKILGGLGFTESLMEAPLHHLSGGWLLRLFIGASLLEKPEVLLLDEPTNHLDLSSIQWLEEFLQKEYQGSLILVTHDVALQKRTTDSLAILHGGRFHFRKHQRDYLTFTDSLVEEKRVLEKSIDGVRKKIDENMEFVEKYRAKAQIASRAQSKLKMAEKLTEELEDLKDRLSRVEGFNYNLRFRFRSSDRGAKFPLALRDIHFHYPNSSQWVLKNISMEIKRGQKIAIIGDNGAGKTTLLNILGSRLQPVHGDLTIGAGVETGYFGQHQLEELFLEDTVLDNLRSRAQGISLEQMRSWLGAFGFHGNQDLSKKAKVLSGGERARLALLRILVTPINVCLLDEPTNHLDIETKELLRRSICEFEGTTIFVSHDRDFIGGIAERILYLSHDHVLTDHLGNLESFFAKYPQFVRHVEGRAKPSTLFTPPESTISYEERKKQKNQLRSLEKKISTVEKEIERLGHEKESLRTKMEGADFYGTTTEAQQNEVYARCSAIESAIHSKMIEWEKWSTELEELKIASASSRPRDDGDAP